MKIFLRILALLAGVGMMFAAFFHPGNDFSFGFIGGILALIALS